MKNNKGITMIALIITIIILLILAGVSIAMLSGKNGILTKASTSAEATKQANAKERLKIELMAIQTDCLSNGKTATLGDLDSNKDQLANKNITVADLGTPRDVTLDGYTFKVKDDLTIEGDGVSTGGTSGGSESGGTGSTTTPTSTVSFYGETMPSPYSGGDGSESNPYLIGSASQLRFLAASVNYGLNTYEGKYIKLNNDIILDSSNQWIPIGDTTTTFKGTFDGNGKKISGININNNTLSNQGLFGILGENGTIKNTTVEGKIKAKSAIGGIVGNNYGTIIKCKNNIKNDGTNCIGGSIGINYATVEECGNFSNIVGNDSTGGITGVNYGIIKKCYNTGSITGGTSSGFGGIAGYNGANNKISYIYNSYNAAAVTGSNWVGGIAGNMGYDSGKGYIYNSYTINNTTIVGASQNSSVIQNCYTTNANIKLNELNSGIDGTEGTDTEQPWTEDTGNINGGYPILKWQN